MRSWRNIWIIFKGAIRSSLKKTLYNGKKVSAGEEIPTHSELILHVGDGGIQEVKDSITSDSIAVEEEIIIEDDASEGDLLLEDDLLF